jgi:hypothetical protein
VILSKLLKLKNWLALSDSAERISIMCGEPVTIADVLQFVDGGHLQLSVNLVNGGYGCECVPVNPDELEYDYWPGRGSGAPPYKIARGGRLFQEGDTVYQVKTEIIALERGIYDLPMIGGERFDVRHLLQQITGGVELDVVLFDGVFLRSQSGKLVEVQERFDQSARQISAEKPWRDPSNFYPSGGGLYEIGDFIVRREALDDFEQLLAEPERLNNEKPLGNRERRGLLATLAAVCRCADIEFEKPAKAASFILRQAHQMGVQLGEATVENYLKQIPDALETRMK